MNKEVKLSNLHEGPIVHPELPDIFVERIKAIKEILGDVDRAPLADTIDAFKRDAHPENELLIWERNVPSSQPHDRASNQKGHFCSVGRLIRGHENFSEPQASKRSADQAPRPELPRVMTATLASAFGAALS